jgi:hypothetical protein
MCSDSERITAKPRNYMMKLKCMGVVLMIIYFNLRQLVRKIVMMLELNTDKSPSNKGR